MVSFSPRVNMLNKYTGRIRKLLRYGSGRACRRYIKFVMLQRQELQQRRYLHRPAKYKPTQFHIRIPSLLRSDPKMFKFLFRVTRSEFNRLVDTVGGYESLNRAPGPGRPPAPPKFQLALFLYRLAHSAEVKAIMQLFGVSEGSVIKWSDNASEAIQTLWKERVFWPAPHEREKIKGRISSRFGVPDCLGFIDGIHIVLHQAPTRPGKSAATYYSRKSRYGLNVVAVVDDKKRFRFVHYGHTAASNDFVVQKDLPFWEDRGGYFEGLEMIIGDSGFACLPWLLAMCKRGRNEPKLYGLDAFFNFKAAPARVTVEHAFGILKARWRCLTDMRLTLKELKDEQRAYGWIKCAMILHNLYVKTYWNSISEAAVKRMMKKSRKVEKWARRELGEEAGVSRLKPNYRRREEVSKQMLKMTPRAERPDMATYEL